MMLVYENIDINYKLVTYGTCNTFSYTQKNGLMSAFACRFGSYSINDTVTMQVSQAKFHYHSKPVPGALPKSERRT